jgi:uncharacterized protein YjbJ (UPF0337 family)
MAITPKDAIEAARDIATHAVERSADIVENAVDILKGNVAEGVGNIVHDSIDIATHAVSRTKELITGRDDDIDDDTDDA